MAERVKRRVAAARLAVAFVAAGTIAGATAWAEAGPAPRAADHQADRKAGKGQQEFLTIKLTSADIENGSLFYKDLSGGQIPSFDQFQKLSQSFQKHKHLAGVKYGDLKGAASNVNGDLNTIKGELGGYLKSTEADARYIKANDAILGDGSVFTATKQAGGQDPVPILGVPNLVSIDALPAEQQIRITNTSGGDLEFSQCGGHVGGGTLKPGESTSCASGDETDVVQLIGGGSSGAVTLNFTTLPADEAGGVYQFTVQILVGL